jgi:hypothetical protein
VSDELIKTSSLDAVPAARITTEGVAETDEARDGTVDRTAAGDGSSERREQEPGQGGVGAPARGVDADALAGTEPVADARTVSRVVRIALLTALVLNTAGFVRAGIGMPAGPTRTAFLAVGHPIDAIAHALDLDRPRHSLDAAFGHPDDTGHGGQTRLEQDAAKLATGAAGPVAGAKGSAKSPQAPVQPSSQAPQPAPVAASVRHATAADPLRVLVTGDSLSDFDGQQLAKLLAAEGLPARLRNEPRNGTGLTQPTMFDWADEAATDAAGYDPDVVVMVLGANDGWPLKGADTGSTAWVAEYKRRVEAVTRDFLAGDLQRRVYWVGPPVPRSVPWIHIFDRINQAIREAVPETPGLRYVDVATPTSDRGAYTDYLTAPDGRRILARQHDGIHYSYPGSVFPARIILAALESEYSLR